MSILSWNIEGFHRNHFNLKHFVDTCAPDLIFLSEPQSYQCDIFGHFDCFLGNYCYILNSEDLICPDLPLEVNKAKGGTMVMWREKLNPFIKVLATTSSSFLPIIVSIPGTPVTAHVAIYLPTSGKEAEFVSALASLDACLVDIRELYACPVYVRGDGNVNTGNKARANIFANFLSKHELCSLDFGHPSHHHFIGDGVYYAAAVLHIQNHSMVLFANLITLLLSLITILFSLQSGCQL